MAGFIEERLKHDLKVLAAVYVETFPFSYARFLKAPADFMEELGIYDALIREKFFDIRAAAASGIQKYCNLYEIMPTNGVDEFKSIYYLGRAIEAQLLAKSYVRMAQIHMYTMIGLMDEKLKSKGVYKDQLTAALTNLVKVREFDDQLGRTGCYLTYKCASTAPNHTKAATGKL